MSNKDLFDRQFDYMIGLRRALVSCNNARDHILSSYDRVIISDEQDALDDALDALGDVDTKIRLAMKAMFRSA